MKLFRKPEPPLDDLHKLVRSIEPIMMSPGNKHYRLRTNAISNTNRFWNVIKWLFIAAIVTGLSIDNGNLSEDLATCRETLENTGA